MLILKIPVIGITGSAGKTTTKEMIAAILQTRWNIFKTPQNHNMVSHTRKYASMITPLHEAVVLEFGMTKPGAIKQHCQHIQPNMGVITNIGSAHIGNFDGSIKRLAQAKSELIENMKPDGVLFINADDNNSKLLRLSGFTGRVIKVGIYHPANYRARNIRFYRHGMSFTVKIGQRNRTFEIPNLGWHNVYNALLAIAVSCELGFSPAEIAAGLRSHKKPIRRLQLKPGINGITVIDDSYSSNPHALKSAVEVLVNVGEKPRVLVLGDMLELGVVADQKHKEIGTYLADKDIQHIATLGKKAVLIGNEAVINGFEADKVKNFFSRNELHQYLISLTAHGGTVLIKGSHDSKMRLTANFLTRVYQNEAVSAHNPPLNQENLPT